MAARAVRATRSLLILMPLASFTMIGYPASETAGTGFGSSNNVVVTAYDAYGNVATNYVGSVYFTFTDTQATLPYTSTSKYTFTSGTGDDNGVHTFAGTGFTLKTAGSQTITVTTGTVSKTSNSITVNPGSASKLVFTVDPTSIVHNTTRYDSLYGTISKIVTVTLLQLEVPYSKL